MSARAFALVCFAGLVCWACSGSGVESPSSASVHDAGTEPSEQDETGPVPSDSSNDTGRIYTCPPAQSLDVIQLDGGAASCMALLPVWQDQACTLPFNPAHAEIQLDASSGESKMVLQVSGSDACEEHGWYYDDAKDPTRIIFCDATCSLIAADPGCDLAIIPGCHSMVVWC